jgi:flagellar motility protein MotE (MotC chaperone)
MRERQAAKILASLPAQKAADISTRIARSKPRQAVPADARTARGGRTS